MYLIDIFRTFHPNAEEYTFCSSVHGTFSRIDHILGHKSNLSKFKKIEIVSSIFSDHNAMRLDINCKKKNCKKHKLESRLPGEISITSDMQMTPPLWQKVKRN